MYAIGFSDELLELSIDQGIGWLDSIWFISSNYTETEKVITYFEKMNRNCEIIKSITWGMNNNEVALFQIKEIDESYLEYLDSVYVQLNNKMLNHNDPDFPFNFISIQGIINCMNGKTKQQKYHNEYFKIEELNTIRNAFSNNMII
jgi:hypothetical protein